MHHLLAAGGGMGIALGMLGTLLMFIMLLYTLRKKLVRVEGLGSLSRWLGFHIICGIMGPVFIIIHAGFVWPKGLVAVAFWCMILVALSGVFGRYVYSFFPRKAGGRALAWDETQTQLADLRAELVAETADSNSAAVGEAVRTVQDFTEEVSSVLDLVRLAAEVRRRKKKVRALLKQARLPSAAQSRAWTTLNDQLELKRGLEASRVAGRLFRYWHLFHRPLAGAMYVIVSLHVAGAILLGGSLAQLRFLWE